MEQRLPNSGITITLQNLLNYSVPEDQVLRLFINDINPDITSVTSDFMEVKGSGYEPIKLKGKSWQFSIVSAEYSAQEFIFTGEIGYIYGYYITQQNSNKLLWAERFDEGPFEIRNEGDRIIVEPSISMT
jgi:hypothetical protein